MPCESAPISKTGSNIINMRYYNMDPVSQATKAVSERKNSTDWTYINLTNLHPSLKATDYIPRASYENKTIFFNKHLLEPGAPNIVTCSFGHNAHTTRCFNWVSKDFYNEYLWFTTTSGDYSNTANKIESFKAGDGRSSTNNRNNAIYDRIRSSLS